LTPANDDELAEIVRKTLIDVCGQNATIDIRRSNAECVVHVNVDGKQASVNMTTMEVRCDDEVFHHLLISVSHRLRQAIAPVLSTVVGDRS
jgi:hypothetical protein